MAGKAPEKLPPKPRKPANLNIAGNASACCITSNNDLVFDDTVIWDKKAARKLELWLFLYVKWRDYMDKYAALGGKI